MWQPVEKAICEATGERFSVKSAISTGGGCINETARLIGDGRCFFVKLNTADRLAMFATEAAGLELIDSSSTLRVPRPICHGRDHQRSWLVLEYVEFGASSPHTSEMLGRQLAAMHRCDSDTFGWDRDNTIGATPQNNSPGSNWVEFFRQQRLGYQLSLAGDNGASLRLLDRGNLLLDALPHLFSAYQPRASLLHGDLWGGNWAADEQGNPVIFDPAVYFGDREADLAMTELFGGFDDRFYQSYRHAWTLDPGYSTRKVLYNLYHILNHYNLFGGGYAERALGMIDHLISEIS